MRRPDTLEDPHDALLRRRSAWHTMPLIIRIEKVELIPAWIEALERDRKERGR